MSCRFKSPPIQITALLNLFLRSSIVEQSSFHVFIVTTEWSIDGTNDKGFVFVIFAKTVSTSSLVSNYS